jgi:uncharacterized membrane protein (Fun14 family)
VSESVIPTIASIGGAFLTGIMIGYFVKKIIKILIFVAGGIVGLLLYLQQQQVISVDIKKFEASSTFILNSMVSPLDNFTQIGDTLSLITPISCGLSAGFAIGVTKG